MKAIVIEIHNMKSFVYTYLDVAKCHDDCEAVHHCRFNPPIMVLKIMKEDGTIDRNTIEICATPEIVKSYTGFDLFNDLETNVRYRFSEGVKMFHCYMIEFELKQMRYPHTSSLHLWDRRDRIIAPMVEYPANLNELPFSFEDFLAE